MIELDKYQIKRFVRDTILNFRDTQARVAGEYGKKDSWLSTILNPDNEVNGWFYGGLLFMVRVHKHSPEAHAILDDEWRRINDEIRGTSPATGHCKTVDDALEAVHMSYLELMKAYRNRAGRSEIKALAAKHGAHTNNLIQALEPQGTELSGSRKLQDVRLKA